MTKKESVMIKKELIEKFKLIKTKTKCHFYDGLVPRERTLYTDNIGRLFVFYNNDLHIVEPYKYIKNNSYTNGMEKIECSLKAGYSWYH